MNDPGVERTGVAYRNYLLVLLLVILAFNSVDRLALGVVLQDIKADLHLSDTQLGLLSGIAFAFFYSFMGIPIARWADKGNRVVIISLTTALWSAAVALCGMAGNFLQLLTIRVGVAVGEAGCVPPAHSLIADYFSRAERPRAVAIYALGGPLSVVIGYFLAGWLNELYGWRMTFLCMGVPGLALALLARVTMREPRRANASMGRPAQIPESLIDVCAALWANATFRHLLFAYSVAAFFGYGILQWQPAFFIRSYGLETGELGTWLTMVYGLGGLIGTYWGGVLASRYAAGNESLQLKVAALMYVAYGAISAGVYLAPNQYVGFALLGLASIGGATIIGPLFATIQTLVPERMRATSIALVYLFANLIGLGFGPLAAGALSDGLHSRFGEDSLRYSLLALTPGYLWGAVHLLRASFTIRRDLAVIQGA